MGFKVTDLIIESVIRDGLESVRRDESIVDDIFGDISSKLGPLMGQKYGDKEIRKIKEYFQENEVSVVHSFAQVPSNLPCISIQLVDNTEKTARTQTGGAYLDDHEAVVEEEITDSEELAALIIQSSISIDSYDSASGTIKISDATDLAAVHANNIFEDVDGTEFPIVGGIIEDDGSKQVMIAAGSELNTVGPALIKSAVNFTQFERRGNQEDEKMLMGIHTQDRLITIYLYILVKYILSARKKDIIDRGYQLSTFSGSDFTRNEEYKGDVVFSRYLTLSGFVQNNWASDKVVPIDLVEVAVKVEKDLAGEECFEDQTVQPEEDDE